MNAMTAKGLCLADALSRIEEIQLRARRDEEDLQCLRRLVQLLLNEERLLVAKEAEYRRAEAPRASRPRPGKGPGKARQDH